MNEYGDSPLGGQTKNFSDENIIEIVRGQLFGWDVLLDGARIAHYNTQPEAAAFASGVAYLNLFTIKV